MPTSRRYPAARRCCTDRRLGCCTPQPHLSSCEADGDRASQLQHAVQSMDGDANLGGAAAVFAKAQTVTDHLFVASDGGLVFSLAAISASAAPEASAKVPSISARSKRSPASICAPSRLHAAHSASEPPSRRRLVTTPQTIGSSSMTKIFATAVPSVAGTQNSQRGMFESERSLPPGGVRKQLFCV